MDGPAPAVINAITDALGVAVNSIPATPEDIFDALSLNNAEVVSTTSAHRD
jgi:CO/xanthine dehydrogenase Mo-binding subunit